MGAYQLPVLSTAVPLCWASMAAFVAFQRRENRGTCTEELSVRERNRIVKFEGQILDGNSQIDTMRSEKKIAILGSGKTEFNPSISPNNHIIEILF